MVHSLEKLLLNIKYSVIIFIFFSNNTFCVIIIQLKEFPDEFFLLL